VTLDGGFEAGKTYQVAYRAAIHPWPDSGSWLRDFVAWLKHQPDAVANVRHAYAFGASQSGRYLRNFLYEGFNTDERDRQVFDGVMAHIAGAARINPERALVDANRARRLQRHGLPICGREPARSGQRAEEGLLDNPRARAHQPKIFYTNTPVETGEPDASPHLSIRRRMALPTSACRTTAASIFSLVLSTRPVGFPHRSARASSSTTRSTTTGRFARCCWRCTGGSAPARRRRQAPIRCSPMARWFEPRLSRFLPFPASPRRAG
jgi:hypothetical protein